VKLSSRKQPALTRRQQLLRVRSQAAAIRSAFPYVERLQIELFFSDAHARAPSPQVHTLYPAAPAFFRFACPCADCDGFFDLTPAIKELLAAPRQPEGTLSGLLRCDGKRFHRSSDVVCSVGLEFRITTSLADAA